MGLDIVAYERLGEFVGPYSEDLQNKLEVEDDGESYIHLFKGDFPERLDGLAPGYYRVMGDRFSFRAGAYSAYGRWRGRLAEIAWPGVKYELKMTHSEFTDNLQAWKREGEPFFELVWFTDCDGVIGPKTCAKLAKDFAEFEDKARRASATDDDAYHENDLLEGEGAFMTKYLRFKEAFELAAGLGCVRFG